MMDDESSVLPRIILLFGVLVFCLIVPHLMSFGLFLIYQINIDFLAIGLIFAGLMKFSWIILWRSSQ